MRPLVLFQGITPPGRAPGPPSLTLQVRGRRRPRLGGGLFSLPQVATGIDVETGTAPPHGRGPLFASQRSPPESTSSGTRRPRMRGGLFSLPQVATSVDFGKDMAPRHVAPGKPQGFSPQQAQLPRRAQAEDAQPDPGSRRTALIDSAPHARCLQQASGLFFFDRAATIPRPGTADFGKGDRRVTIAPGKPQGFSSQRAQPPSAFRLKTCRQYRLRDGLRRDERGAARQEPSASPRAFHLRKGGHHSASRH